MLIPFWRSLAETHRDVPRFAPPHRPAVPTGDRTGRSRFSPRDRGMRGAREARDCQRQRGYLARLGSAWYWAFRSWLAYGGASLAERQVTELGFFLAVISTYEGVWRLEYEVAVFRLAKPGVSEASSVTDRGMGSSGGTANRVMEVSGAIADLNSALQSLLIGIIGREPLRNVTSSTQNQPHACT